MLIKNGLCYLKNKNINLTEDYHKKLRKFLKDQKRNIYLDKKIRSNKVNIIFQIIMYDSNKDNNDYIEIRIKNADSAKILSSGKLASYKKRNLQFMEENIDEEIKVFITDFLNRYFLTSIEIVDLDLNENYEVIRNGEKLNPNKDSYIINDDKNSIIIYDIPLYVNSYIQLESDTKISKKFEFKNISRNFLLEEPNRPLNINKKNLLCDCNKRIEKLSQDCYTVCNNRESIKIQVRDKFPVARLKLQNNKGISMTDVDPEINLISFKNNNSIKGIQIDDFYEFRSNYEGKYLSLMQEEKYASPFPFLIEFKDSSNFNSFSKMNKISLYKKSKPISHTLNIALPGLGLFYFEDKKWISSLHLSMYLMTVAFSHNSYQKFIDYRSEYNQALSNYNMNPNSLNRTFVENKYSLAYNSKNEFRKYAGLAIILNILSNYYLDQIFKDKIKW